MYVLKKHEMVLRQGVHGHEEDGPLVEFCPIPCIRETWMPWKLSTVAR